MLQHVRYARKAKTGIFLPMVPTPDFGSASDGSPPCDPPRELAHTGGGQHLHQMGRGVPCAQHGGRDSGKGGWHKIVCRFGTPRVLHSDQGRTFEGWVMKELARTLGMDKMQITPYHPQADGQVERFNRTLAAKLAAVVAPDQSDWDEDLPFLTAPHPATGHRPNFMMFG